VTVILILIFGFLVTRNFWKLVGERRRGDLGSHLNLKFVAAFVLIALVTTSGLSSCRAFFIHAVDRQMVQRAGRPRRSRRAERSPRATTSRPRTNAMFYGSRIAEHITVTGCCATAPRRISRTWSRASSASTTSASSRSSAKTAMSW